MYQKEIIYIGLYKDGNRIGNAGFLKIESRGQESRLDLKIRNLPLNIKGRFPVRIHSGNDWKEINGISVQEGGGCWEENMPDTVQNVQIQVTLPGGYSLDGRSKSRQTSSVQEKETTGKLSDAGKREGTGRASGNQETEKPGQLLADQRKGILKERFEVRENEGLGEQLAGQTDTAGGEHMDKHAETIAERFHDRQEKVTADMLPEQKMDMFDSMQKDRGRLEGTEPGAAYGIWEKADGEALPDKQTGSDNWQNPKTVIVTEELQHFASERKNGNSDFAAKPFEARSLKEDKWEQILDSYEQIHPYGDERVYVRLEPKDFIILQSRYQHLVNNSFLLHGFYNYRYLILGKEDDYYLGVPGVFYEREKMVALMFGFEAFECPGGVARAGEFGYYLRKVEL